MPYNLIRVISNKINNLSKLNKFSIVLKLDRLQDGLKTTVQALYKFSVLASVGKCFLEVC